MWKLFITDLVVVQVDGTFVSYFSWMLKEIYNNIVCWRSSRIIESADNNQGIQTAICLLFFFANIEKRLYWGSCAQRAPWVGKNGNLYMREILVITWPSVRPHVPPTTVHVSQSQMSYLLLTILRHGRSLWTWKMIITCQLYTTSI